MKLPFIVIALGAALLQVVVGSALSIRGIQPSFVLVAVYAYSITGGEARGILNGALGGLIEDCLSGGVIGLMTSGYAIAGYIAGRAGKKVFNIGESANFGGIFIVSLVQGAYTAAILNAFKDSTEIFYMILTFALPQALYNAVAGIFVLWLFKKQLARRVPWLRPLRPGRYRL
jgi:rod shape-determining protein MreD